MGVQEFSQPDLAEHMREMNFSNTVYRDRISGTAAQVDGPVRRPGGIEEQRG
jgi:hypothetical protein